MKYKLLIVLLLVIGVFTILTVNNKKEDKKIGLAFKTDYEEVNGKENKNGKKHREVNISEDNKFIEITVSDLIKKIDNEETFYVYFGSRLCPWCRSTIEKADKISRDNNIEKVYYIDIWDDEGNEILRDKYIVNDSNELEVVIEKSEEYDKLLQVFDSVLDNYTLTNSNGEEIETNEKRIYAPNYIYVEKGKAVRLVTGISELQKDSREELTEEMLDEEEEIFNEFFTNSCNDLC
jgi:thiol-disulfide isomerase/thioredoxin